jgi:adenine/guanine phosphoribosyltransferase-like PRPP-binding protein
MKSSFVELEGRDKRRPIQYLDIKMTMESRNKGEAAVEELLERVDISKVMTNSYDAIVLGRLLAQLQLYYNIPLESKV